MSTILQRLGAYTPPQDFEPIEIEYRLSTPPLLGYPWIFSDGLLARQLMIDLLGDDFFDLPAKSPLPIADHLRLPLATTKKVYHASAAIFDTPDMHTTTLYKRFHEADDLKTKARIRRGSGKFRDYMLKFPYSPTNTVKLYMNGNRDEIERLMVTVHHIGKKHAAGGGEVAAATIRRIDEDFSLIQDGKAARSIPAGMLATYDMGAVMRMAYRPPYWDQKNVALCVCPGGRCKL